MRWAAILIAIVTTVAMGGPALSQGLTVTTDGFEAGVQGTINDAQVLKHRQDVQRAERRRQENAASFANGLANGGGNICRSGDRCFDVVRVERDYTEILCKKGSEYNIGQKKRICGSGEKWGGCGMTDAFAHHHTMTKAGNMQCD